jgi:CubicO group peptidase (beta-lactamase class C family)
MKRMRFFLLSVLLIILFLSTLGASAALDRTDFRIMSPRAFVTYINKRIPELMKEAKIPGAAVTLVHKGQILQVRGFGYRDKAKKLPVTADTVFQVGSISKSMTAWGIMKLAQDGQIKLNFPLDTYLFRWRLPASKYDHSKVTIRGLLSDTAGISVEKYPGYHPSKKPPALQEILAGKRLGLEKVYVKYEPGEYHYSEGGYALLQLVLEEVTREDFAGYMEREVLTPLGLQNTSFRWRSDLQPKTATAYDMYGLALPNYIFTVKAATGLYSTPVDLGRWMVAANQAFLGKNQVVLEQRTCQTLYSPVFADYGLGCAAEILPFGERFVSSYGANHGWKAYYGLLTQEGSGIAILTNSDRGMNLIGPLMDDWFAWQGLNRRTVVVENLPLYFLDLYTRVRRLFL